MPDSEQPKADVFTHIAHEAILEVAEGLLEGVVTPADIAYVNEAFGPLVVYEGIPDIITEEAPKDPALDHTKKMIDSVFSNQQSLAPEVLRGLLGGLPEELQEVANRVRSAYLDIAAENADYDLLAWAFGATDREIIDATLKHAEEIQAQDKV